MKKNSFLPDALRVLAVLPARQRVVHPSTCESSTTTSSRSSEAFEAFNDWHFHVVISLTTRSNLVDIRVVMRSNCRRFFHLAEKRNGYSCSLSREKNEADFLIMEKSTPLFLLMGKSCRKVCDGDADDSNGPHSATVVLASVESLLLPVSFCEFRVAPLTRIHQSFH